MQMRGRVTVLLYAEAGHRCLLCQGKYGLRVRIKKDLMMHLMHGCVLRLQSRSWGIYHPVQREFSDVPGTK